MKTITRDKERYYIVIKGSIHKEHIMIDHLLNTDYIQHTILGPMVAKEMNKIKNVKK